MATLRHDLSLKPPASNAEFIIAVGGLLGCGRIPKDRTAASRWLKKFGFPITVCMADARKPEQVSLSDLPQPERLTFLARRADAMGLPMGIHDDAAHLALAAKPVTVQNTAYARAETMMFIAKHEAAGLKWGQIAGLLKAEAAKDGSAVLAPSHATKLRWDGRIAGVDTVNWAPALAPAYQGRTATAELSPEAWEQFEFYIYAAGKNSTGYPLKAAWEKVMVDAAEQGWAWPCYRTVMRHWDRLDEARKRVLRDGEKAAAKSLRQSNPRTVKDMFAMQQVELDGREFKVLVRFADGRIGCPWVIIYVDRASNRILSHVVSESENEEATADATIRMCETHGIPDLVYTDNGAAFNGMRMAGGLNPLIRRKNTRRPDWEVPGVLKLFGIKLGNTGPNRGQSKIPESVFSIMRRLDNDPVFYRAQRSGPKDAPNPDPVPVDIELFKRALAKYINEFNARKGSRAEGILPGESRNDAFVRLSVGRIHRPVTTLQSRSVRMKWYHRTVMGDGRVRFPQIGLFGDATTQHVMLKHVGKKVLVGINPSDFSAPAMVRHWQDEAKRGELLLDRLPIYEATRHGDAAGLRRAVADDRRAKKLAEKHKVLDVDRKVAALREAIMRETSPSPVAEKPKIVALNTDMPFSDKPESAAKSLHPLQARLRANLERNLAAGKAAG